MRKFLFSITAVITLITLSFYSCRYDNKEDLYPKKDTTISGCDTISVTYNVQIKPFFDNNCTSCHSSGGTYPSLDNFSAAHTYATTPGNVLYYKVSTNHKNKNPTDCEIAQIKKWVNTGAN